MLGSIISAGASLLGGIMSKNSNEKIAGMNYAQQKEFAQNGIRWKVDDAKRSGIHPLFALGAQTMPFSPSVHGGGEIGNAISNAGSDIGRGIDAHRTSVERNQARLDALTLERGELENQLLRSQIAKINQPGHPPALPSGVNNGKNHGLVEVNPSQVITGDTVVHDRQPGNITEYQFGAPSPDGSVPLYMSKDAKERTEDDFIASMLWHLQNRWVAPKHPGGLEWNPIRQRYQKPSWFTKKRW